MEAVLVLNADYTLLEVTDWQRAVSLLFREKARLVEDYAGRFLHSPSVTMGMPAVIVRSSYVKPKKQIRLSRKNLLARDFYTCQYCGDRPKKKNGGPNLEELTLDHVVPRAHARGGHVVLPWSKKQIRTTSWENLLTACRDCNSAKADQTPDQAGLKMKKLPKTPSSLDVAWISLFKYEIPAEWQLYLPEGSPWREYWDVELDPA